MYLKIPMSHGLMTLTFAALITLSSSYLSLFFLLTYEVMAEISASIFFQVTKICLMTAFRRATSSRA